MRKAVELCSASIEKEDLEKMLDILDTIKPQVILEIGTWRGFSAELWIAYFNPELFMTIEKDDPYRLGKSLIIADLNVHYFWNTDSHSVDAVKKVSDLLGSRQVDFLFIDGGHTFEDVQQDYSIYSLMVRKGGVIAFHDAYYYAEGTEEVNIFREKLEKQGHKFIKIQETLNSTGIAIEFKK